MSVFDYRLNRKEQLVRKGEPIDNSVDFSGKTSPDFRNKFIAKMKDTNKMYQRESPGQFDDQRADVVRSNLLAQADDLGQFNDPTQQVKSDAFLAKRRSKSLMSATAAATAAKTGVTMAGKKLGDFLVRQGIKVGGKAGGYAVKEAGRIAADVGKRAAVEAALGMAIEQGLPRAMGEEPRSSVAESALRQGSSAVISQGLQVGATRRFPEATASNIGTRVVPTAGFIAGQIGGKRITDAAFGAQREFAPVQDTPTGATIASQEPEPVEIIKDRKSVV